MASGGSLQSPDRWRCASVLLLGEPAAGLSSVESAELARVVRRLADEWGMAILLVEHDMNFVMGVCDSVVVIDFGNKIAEGTPEEIRNDPAVIEAYLGQQSDDDLGIEQPAGGERELTMSETMNFSEMIAEVPGIGQYVQAQTPHLLEPVTSKPATSAEKW